MVYNFFTLARREDRIMGKLLLGDNDEFRKATRSEERRVGKECGS